MNSQKHIKALYINDYRRFFAKNVLYILFQGFGVYSPFRLSVSQGYAPYAPSLRSVRYRFTPLTALIFSVQRLRRNEKLMRTSAPRYAPLIVLKKPPALVSW